jgi:hypothetical protein
MIGYVRARTVCPSRKWRSPAVPRRSESTAGPTDEGDPQVRRPPIFLRGLLRMVLIRSKLLCRFKVRSLVLEGLLADQRRQEGQSNGSNLPPGQTVGDSSAPQARFSAPATANARDAFTEHPAGYLGGGGVGDAATPFRYYGALTQAHSQAHRTVSLLQTRNPWQLPQQTQQQPQQSMVLRDVPPVWITGVGNRAAACTRTLPLSSSATPTPGSQSPLSQRWRCH